MSRKKDKYRTSKWARVSRKMRKVWRYYCWQVNDEAASCMSCGLSEAEGVKLTTDHIDTWQNKETRFDLTLMQVLCSKCNSSKQGKPNWRPPDFAKWIQDERNIERALTFMRWHEQQYLTAVEQGCMIMPRVTLLKREIQNGRSTRSEQQS